MMHLFDLRYQRKSPIGLGALDVWSGGWIPAVFFSFGTGTFFEEEKKEVEQEVVSSR